MSLRAGLGSSVLAGLLALMLSACTMHAPLQAGASDTMTQPLTATPGDAAKGRAIVANRQVGLCLLCHTGPFPEERFQGNLAPSLAGAGSRWSEGQLRLRISDARRFNPASIMPAYHPAGADADPSARVGAAWKEKPILDAQQIEDVVAFLRTLRE
jgi:L-cysteine S-thiosulfotransferase